MMNSIMWRYIAQEPEVLDRLMKTDVMRDFAQQADRRLQAVYLVAHGSSYNAAVSTADFLAGAAGLRVYPMTPANFCCGLASLLREERGTTLVAAISQTGTSAGAVEALAKASQWGFPTLGITDVKNSPIAEEARWSLPLMCGEEDSNAKTKGYSATLLLLLLLGIELGVARGELAGARADALRRELNAMIGQIPALTEKALEWCRDQDFGAHMGDLYVLGSGMNFGTAQEGQLKLMETVCIPTMFNDIGEFSHGMHRSITEQSSILLLRTGNEYADLTLRTYRYLRTVAKNVWMIDASGDPPADSGCICVPAFPETQSLLLTALVIQVLSVYAPERRGVDPNRDAHNDFTRVVGTRVR